MDHLLALDGGRDLLLVLHSRLQHQVLVLDPLLPLNLRSPQFALREPRLGTAQAGVAVLAHGLGQRFVLHLVLPAKDVE